MTATKFFSFEFFIVALLLLIFWVMQAVAQIFFKYGSGGSSVKWWLGFAAGNVVGGSSILLLMKLYVRMNPNLALALGTGGAFLVSQVVLSWVFDSHLLFSQWIGLLLITAGMLLASSDLFYK
ncbi:MAG: hypothetical protein KJ964_12520 [Verrucomicrobia bacterium]|nr:hypothetical protein [Verrucomicrobiota bacterium]MBU1736244.1 hypothetical protein [Verrucomicrobiota bacterium]MBU1856974.1 hypothetical protein [Verrucomicrobiota bacterium]